jgi:hypothetical protein
MSNNLLSNKCSLLIAAILSVMMLAASMVPSLFSTTAFAASDDDDDDDVVVDPTIQASVQTAQNINVDPDVIVSKGCVDISDDDEVTQVNEQTVKQEVHKNNDVGDGGIVVEPTVQASVQIAQNINVDKNVFIVLGCNDGDVEISDDDEVTQVNEQTVKQEVDSDSEVGDGGLILSPTIQKSANYAQNYNQDDDHVILIPFPDL